MSLNRSAANPYNLERFVSAQHSIYAEVVSELRAGMKTSHWMWFVFPQLAGTKLDDLDAGEVITKRT